VVMQPLSPCLLFPQFPRISKGKSSALRQLSDQPQCKSLVGEPYCTLFPIATKASIPTFKHSNISHAQRTMVSGGYSHMCRVQLRGSKADPCTPSVFIKKNSISRASRQTLSGPPAGGSVLSMMRQRRTLHCAANRQETWGYFLFIFFPRHMGNTQWQC
jgi:hypothetical protein